MGFDFNRFTDLSKREAKHLICCICLHIYNNAINTECGHTFCKHCLQKWIEDKHNVCPECRKEFTRKRSTDVSNNDILIMISNHVFSRNLKINAIINELNFKCDYDFNGCQQSVELGLLSSHLKDCEHRFCEKCGFTAGPPEHHNCVELMKNDRNEWKKKFNEIKEQKTKLGEELQRNRIDMNRWKSMYEKSVQINKELSEKISQLKEVTEKNENEFNLKCYKLEENETKLRQEIDSRKDFICRLTSKLENKELSTEYVLFGTHSMPFCKLVLRPNRVYFKSPLEPQFFLPIAYIEELMFCLDNDLPVIVIKANIISGKAIRNNIRNNLSDPSMGCYDVESLDPSHWYIIIRFPRASIDFIWQEHFIMVILYLLRCKPKVMESIEANRTRQMLDSAFKKF